MILGCRLVPFGLLACLVSLANAQAPKPRPNEPVIVTYDVKDIVNHANWSGIASNPTLFGGLIGERTEQEKRAANVVDDLVRAIIDVIDGFPGNLRQGIWSIREVNGTHLEIKTTKSNHEQIVDLLDAFRRLLDVAVVVEAELREVDRSFFDKQIVAKFAQDQAVTPGRSAIRIDDGTALERLRKESELVKTGVARVANAWKEAPVLSVRTVFLYAGPPAGPQKGKADPVLTAGFHGVACRAAAAVAADRRSLRLKIVQEVADLVAIRKEKQVNRLTNNEVEIETPDLRHRSSDLTLTVDDGQVLLLPVDARVPSGKDRDRLLVLVLQATIRIEAEEKELKKDNGL